MVVMGRDGRPVHRFEIISTFIGFWADVQTMGIMTDEQLDGRSDNRTDVLRGAPVQDRDKCSQSSFGFRIEYFPSKVFPFQVPPTVFHQRSKQADQIVSPHPSFTSCWVNDARKALPPQNIIFYDLRVSATTGWYKIVVGTQKKQKPQLSNSPTDAYNTSLHWNVLCIGICLRAVNTN